MFHEVLITRGSLAIKFSLSSPFQSSSPCTTVRVSLHKSMITRGSPFISFSKDTVAPVVYAHRVNLKYSSSWTYVILNTHGYGQVDGQGSQNLLLLLLVFRFLLILFR